MTTTDEVSPLTFPLSLGLLILAALLGLLAVLLPGYQMTQHAAAATVDLTQPATAEALTTAPVAPGRVAATGNDRLTVTYSIDRLPDGGAVPPALMITTQLGTSVWLLGLAGICFLLARVLADIARGRPFAPGQARRFTGVAAAILVCSVGADTINYLHATALLGAGGNPTPLVVAPYYSTIPIVLALVTLVLAGAFRAGTRIARDTEGLV